MQERIRSTPPIADATRTAGKNIQRLARSAVPALADFAVVFVVTGRWIVGVASAHSSPQGQRLLRTLQRIYRVRRDDLYSTVAQVVRTGKPALRRTILHETDAQPPRGSVADLHRQLACRSALVIPIQVGSTVTGAVTLCYAGSGRSYAPADLAHARRVARETTLATPKPLHAATRLRTATGNARRPAAIGRRVAPRN